MNDQAVIHDQMEAHVPLLREELNAQMGKLHSIRLPILLLTHSKQQALQSARDLHEQSSYHKTPYVELDVEDLTDHEQRTLLTRLFASRARLTLHIVGVELLDDLQQQNLCSLIEEYQTTYVHIIASTSVSLFKRMCEGRFNRDLFYYLNVIPFELPLIGNDKKEEVDLKAELKT